MPRARYSEKQAGGLLTVGRVFLLRLSENPKPTEAYAIVTGREDGVVDYSFLDVPGDNRSTVVELYPRIAGFEDVRKDYAKKVEAGEKVAPLTTLFKPKPMHEEGIYRVREFVRFLGRKNRKTR